PCPPVQFKQSSRRYCKQQMQWWRRKAGVCWVSMDEGAVGRISAMNEMGREEWEKAVGEEGGESERVKRRNEEQGKGMKRFISKEGWEEGEIEGFMKERDYWHEVVKGRIDNKGED
ncbi:hypothetical protein TrRE_jg6830, partial [Triparma retinervis]